MTHNSCEVFSESQSTTRKAAAVEKVTESVVSSSYIWSENISGGSRPGHKVSGTRSKSPNLNENG